MAGQVVADRLSLRVRETLKKHDVAKASWLVECIDNRKLREPGPADFLGMTPETEEKMRDHYDRYGDSYREVSAFKFHLVSNIMIANDLVRTNISVKKILLLFSNIIFCISKRRLLVCL